MNNHIYFHLHIVFVIIEINRTFRLESYFVSFGLNKPSVYMCARYQSNIQE